MFQDVLNDKQANVLIQELHRDKNFQRFLIILQNEINKLRIKNDVLEGVELTWNQGRCQATQEILNLSNRIEKMRNRQ